MTASNRSVVVPGSQTQNWRPWGLQAYHGLHTVRGLDDPIRQSVLALIGDVVNAAVDCLRKRGVALLWRVETKPDGPTRESSKLNAALAIVHHPR